VPADAGLVLEEVTTGWCGAVVEVDQERVSLEDRHGKVRVFPLQTAGFLLEGQSVTLSRPVRAVAGAPRRTASGSVPVSGRPAQVAKASRIWVEGTHDAELVERVWGDDLRVEGVVVEPLDGVDDLARTSPRSVPPRSGGSACSSTTSCRAARRAASWRG